MTCFCHAESRIYDFKPSQVDWLSKHFALRYVHEPRDCCCRCCRCWCNIAINVLYSFFQWILWYNRLKRILHFWWAEVNRCTEFIAFECFRNDNDYFAFKSQQKLVIKLSMDFSQKETNRQAKIDSKTATTLNQNKIEATQYEPHLMRTIIEFILHWNILSK